jgi:hypothetical protein
MTLKALCGREAKLKESYSQKYKRFDEELDDTVPRQVRLRLSGLIIVFFLYIGLVLGLGTVTFAAIPELKENLAMSIGVVGIPFSIVTMIFAYYFYSQREMVRSWIKIKGKVESTWEETVKGQVVFKWEVKYQHKEGSFSKTISGYPDGRIGDPVILLMNPRKPGSCVSYAPDLL